MPKIRDELIDFPHDCLRNQVVCQTCRDNWLDFNVHIRDPRMRYTERLSDEAAKAVIRGLLEPIRADFQFLLPTFGRYVFWVVSPPSKSKLISSVIRLVTEMGF